MQPNPNGIMPEATFCRVIEDIRAFGIERVKLIGGEPTIHPRFPEMVRRLGVATKYLQLVTNAQWRDPAIAEAVIDAVDLIEISIDAGGREVFEAARRGASYDRLLQNLAHLAQLKRQKGARSTINVRLMVRPSTQSNRRAEERYYRQWADTVMPQNLLAIPQLGYTEDVYVAQHIEEGSFPRCTHPFKCLEVKWSGDMPLCGPNSYVSTDRRISLGNLSDTTMVAAWNDPRLRQYRLAHRRRDPSMMPACRGCKGI